MSETFMGFTVACSCKDGVTDNCIIHDHRGKSMKLFYFKRKGYGEEACVMAESREDAIRAIDKNLRAKISEATNTVVEPGYNVEGREAVRRGTISSTESLLDAMTTTNREFSIVELGPGEIVWTEIS